MANPGTDWDDVQVQDDIEHTRVREFEGRIPAGSVAAARRAIAKAAGKAIGVRVCRRHQGGWLAIAETPTSIHSVRIARSTT